EAGLEEDSAVGDGGHHARNLYRRRQDGALANRHVRRVAEERRAPPPPRGRDEPRLLSRQVDARGRPEAEGARVARDRVHPDPEARLVEVDVAGLDDRVVEVDGAVTALLPVAERPVAEVE